MLLLKGRSIVILICSSGQKIVFAIKILVFSCIKHRDLGELRGCPFTPLLLTLELAFARSPETEHQFQVAATKGISCVFPLSYLHVSLCKEPCHQHGARGTGFLPCQIHVMEMVLILVTHVDSMQIESVVRRERKR